MPFLRDFRDRQMERCLQPLPEITDRTIVKRDSSGCCEWNVSTNIGQVDVRIRSLNQKLGHLCHLLINGQPKRCSSPLQ
jgi:hypothetical protein